MFSFTVHSVLCKKEILNESSISSKIIQELLDNGQAFELEKEIEIPLEEFYRLSHIDLQLLGLPEFYPFDIRILSISDLGQNDFHFNLEFVEHSKGLPLNAKRTGCLLEEVSQETKYLLSDEQFQLCEAVEEHNQLLEKKSNVNFINFAKIKNLAKECQAILDSYLENENVFTPEKISLDLKQTDDDSISVMPELEDENNKPFQKKFDRFPQPKNIYSLSNLGGKRERIVFTEEQKTELEKIKRLKRVSGEEKENFFNQPQDFVDSEIINLDDFSERVFGIGFYKPRFYPFITIYKTQWIPGFIVEKSPEERVKISLKKEDLEEIKKLTEEAKQSDRKSVVFKGTEIPIRQAEKMISFAEKQNESKEPIKNIGEETVLLIHENVDLIEFEEKEFLETNLNFYFEQPQNLNENLTLLEHQIEGITWLQSLQRENYRGGLLADDMGLGKTLQIFAFIAWHYEKNMKSKKPYLIVAPISILENWENEFNKFISNGQKIIRFYGKEKKSTQIDSLGSESIVLTNYETLRINQKSFGKINWAICALDEAQRIKSPGTLVTNSAKALKADFKIASTGTPVENTLVDLWCLTDFLIPGLLGSCKDFAKIYQDPLQDEDTDIRALGEKLRSQIGIFFIRRMKKNILQGLPNKNIVKLEMEMPNEQKAKYLEESNRTKGFEENNRNNILNILSALRDISDHPMIAHSNNNFLNLSADQLITKSAKLMLTIEQLEKIEQLNEKVIIFTHLKKTQLLLQQVIEEKFGIKVKIINGDTPTSSTKATLTRQQTIDKFQSKSGFNVIIMSPIAAGYGLNVTEANHVIHYTRHWNPAKEAQATDRVYRIGQEKDVFIYFPISTSSTFETFDEKLDKLLLRKTDLASASLFPTERIEVTPMELFSDLEKQDVPKDIENKPLTIEEIDNLDPFLFEAAIGVLMRKNNYEAKLTPKSKDKGADLVCFSENKNLLIQIKQSINIVSDSCIGEILKAEGFYKEKYLKTFQLVALTNSEFTAQAIELASSNSVKLITRENLLELVKENRIFMSEIHSLEKLRINRF
ncbi:MAG: helicase SNF2 [Calditrichaeota bacterium]|nr:MAG: helicase SNF2 [Calditrichota bacterium]